MTLVDRLSVKELPAWPTSDSAGRTFCLDGDSGGCKSPPHRKCETLALRLHTIADIASIDGSMAAVGGLRAIALHNATVRFRVSSNAIAVVHGTAVALQAEKDHPPGLKIATSGTVGRLSGDPLRPRSAPSLHRNAETHLLPSIRSGYSPPDHDKPDTQVEHELS